MANQFREVEDSFNLLKRKFGEKKISKREFIDSLKELRIRDVEGRFWMIGAQTGKWYFFDGNDWIQAQPPSFEERKVICITCGYENDIEAEVCVRCGGDGSSDRAAKTCPTCGTELDDPASPCRVCEHVIPPKPRPSLTTVLRGIFPASVKTGFVIRSVHPWSFFVFFGACGVFSGMLLGLLFGVTSFFPGFVAALPDFFRDIQGTLLGGIVFTILGGVLGFIFGAGGGILAAAAVNGILSLTGGMTIGADRIDRKE